MLGLFKRKRKDEFICSNDLMGCIGKLPIYQEFIKHGVIRPELARLDQWYQSAYHSLSQRYGKDVKTIFSQMPPHNYLYYANNNPSPMLGTVMASSDQSGRVYPYVIFRMLGNPLARELPNAIPVMYADYLETIRIICSSTWEGKSLPDIFAKINMLNKTASHISRRKTLETMVNNIDLNIDNILPIIKDTKQREPWGLRLPLPDSELLNAGVVFWLERIKLALGKQEVFLQMFWNAASARHKPALTIFFKPMPAAYFSYLVDQDLVSDKLVDLTARE